MTPAHTTPPALWGQRPGPSRFGAHTQLAQVPISRVTRCFCSILPSKQSCKVQNLGEETNTILRVWTAERLQTQSTSVSSHPAVTLLWDAPCPPALLPRVIPDRATLGGHSLGCVPSHSSTPGLGYCRYFQGLTNPDGSRKNLLLPAEDKEKEIIHSYPQSNPCRQVLSQISNHLPLETTKQALKKSLYF